MTKLGDDQILTAQLAETNGRGPHGNGPTADSDWEASFKSRIAGDESTNGQAHGDTGRSVPNRFAAHLHTLDSLRLLPRPEPIIEGVLYADTLTVAHGPPKSFKSFVLMDMALSIATGTWWHGQPVHQRTVVYVVAEGQATTADRVDAWRLARNVRGVEHLHLLPMPVNLFNLAHVGQFIEAVRDLHPGVVFFDTLARCTAGADENSAKDMGIIIEQLDHVRSALGGAAIGVAHHDNRSGSNMRGSSALDGAADVSLTIAKDANIITAKVEFAKHFADGAHWRWSPVPHGESIALGRPRGGDDAVTESGIGILEALAKFDPTRGATNTQWQKAAAGEVSERSYYRLRDGLVAQKLVAVTGPEKGARYAITAAGIAVVAGSGYRS
jgi:hypothetical protein